MDNQPDSLPFHDDQSDFDPSDFYQRRVLHSSTTDANNDEFFQLLYDYYQTGGLTCVVLSHGSFLTRTLFSILFTAAIATCFNRETFSLSDAQCSLSSAGNAVRLITSVFLLWWGWVAWQAGKRIHKMIHIKRVWEGNLGLPSDVRFVSWPLIMERYSERINPDADPHHIVNRIMRWDNYFIALLTKDVLALETPKVAFFSKLLEWHLRTAIKMALFREDGILIEDVMHYARRQEYVDRLNKVFRRAGLLSIVTAPFLFVAFIVYFAYRHVGEYHKNPQAIAAHCFTPLAKWKLRDFNELPHIYLQRLQSCHPRVLDFMSQFSSEEFAIILRCISFLLGSVLLVLVAASLFEADWQLSLFGESRPILFYTGIVGALFVAIQREPRGVFSASSGETLLATSSPSLVPDPDAKFEELAITLRCMPFSWKSMTTRERYNEIKRLFRYRWEVFLPELASVVTLPFILLFHCPKRSSNIVSFFRENSVHVDHLGIVCSCAMFDQNQKRMIVTENDTVHHHRDSDDMYRKMQASAANFTGAYPLWQHNGKRKNIGQVEKSPVQSSAMETSYYSDVTESPLWQLDAAFDKLPFATLPGLNNT